MRAEREREREREREQVDVDTFSFSYSEDPRSGYLEAGNTVVNISWEPPVGEQSCGCVPPISHFTLFVA